MRTSIPVSSLSKALVAALSVLSLCTALAQEMAPAIVPNPCQAYESDPMYARCNQKLGLPKEDAARVLTAAQRDFLDRVRRIYEQDGLLANRAEAIKVLGAEVEKTGKSDSTSPGGVRSRKRYDLFKSQGYFTASLHGSRSRYWYEGPHEDQRHLSTAAFYVSLSAEINWERECISSMAAEGYLDIPLTTHRNAPHGATKSALEVDRRAQAGGYQAGARALSNRHPGLELGYVDGCLASINLYKYFNLREISDEKIYD